MPRTVLLPTSLLALGLLACAGIDVTTPPTLSGLVTKVALVHASTFELVLPTFSGRGLPLKVPVPEHFSVTLQRPSGANLWVRSASQLQPGTCVGLYVSEDQLEDRPILKSDQIKEVRSSWCRQP
jgi:hypothetical protein